MKASIALQILTTTGAYLLARELAQVRVLDVLGAVLMGIMVVMLWGRYAYWALRLLLELLGLAFLFLDVRH